MSLDHIRNFSIIAHIDHGKSTLADRLLEFTGAVSEREKTDLPSADPERVRKDIEDIIGLDASSAILASAKEGIGTQEILEGIINHFPPPKGDPDAPLRALIIDSWFDPYHGAVVMMRLFDGTIRKGTKIRMMSSGRVFEVTRVGIYAPEPVEVAEMKAGEVGFLMAGIKE